MQEFNLWVKLKIWQKLFFFLIGAFLGIFFLLTTCYFLWERNYAERLYPGVEIAGKDFGGKTSEEVEDHFLKRNTQLSLNFTFIHKEEIATLSAQEINWGYDVKLIAAQAFSFGRSKILFSDLYQKAFSFRNGWEISPSYSYSEQKLSTFLEKLAEVVNIAPQEALFRFSGGKVTVFQPSTNGQAIDVEKTKKILHNNLSLLKENALPESLVIELPIMVVEPEVTTEEANSLGVKELVGSGTSRFAGSIANRVHNIQLAASRLDGILVPPGKEFSFNNALGDVSKLTGYKEAYIIQEGRTILGDGGGVCQVSTTFFRAILNAGLPITERHPHSYRVAYYEQASPVGLDASVYSPRWDLKFRNDTKNYLLVQSSVNHKTATLDFELYGTSDDRIVAITKPAIKNQVAPPEDLHQEDPNLPKGEVKQIDWKAWGADVSFSRTVKRGEKVLISETFSSHYQPWQAVYLVGTKEE